MGLRNVRVRASADEIAKSLQGNWRAEHLFALKQALGAFDFVGTQLSECDQQIELQLQSLQTHDGDPAKGKKRGRARNAPKFDPCTQLFRMCGVDLTRIDGIDITTALAVVSEVGTDRSRFPTIKHFTSWLGLCPGTKITGGQGHEWQDQASGQPGSPGLTPGRRRAAQQQAGSWCVLPPNVLTNGQTQGRHRRRSQAGPAHLHDAHQGRGVHRPRPGLLRGALS